MEKINAIVKKWGNSFGIILPKEIIKTQELKEGSNIELIIHSKNKTKVKDIFGILKGKIKRDTADLLKEVDRDFE
ncbi:AbrB/MazE/SpoVT family DNA-binding domain-containing protein [Candidatus Pacearchaeota archaeon]|nr:AbrB/MazE/SpoVT family DNA-binding domain-containing protein [Candidatus Pacearchaeota archaeon]